MNLLKDPVWVFGVAIGVISGGLVVFLLMLGAQHC